MYQLVLLCGGQIIRQVGPPQSYRDCLDWINKLGGSDWGILNLTTDEIIVH